MESILTSIKKLIGMTADYNHFDTDVIMHINDAFMTLNQIGVGPERGFMITGDSENWEDFLGDTIQLEGVKTYIYYRVRLGFDPPAGSLLESMNRRANELEWRLQAQNDYINKEENQDG